MNRINADRLLLAVTCAAPVSTELLAATPASFFDDFEDGDATEGNPVTWTLDDVDGSNDSRRRRATRTQLVFDNTTLPDGDVLGLVVIALGREGEFR